MAIMAAMVTEYDGGCYNCAKMADQGLNHEFLGKRGRPLKRLSADPKLWGKVHALWHRERRFDELVHLGDSPQVARELANQEALEVARSFGWNGKLSALKVAMSDLLENRFPGLKTYRGRRIIKTWNDYVHEDLLHLLQNPPGLLRKRFVEWARGEAGFRGSFWGEEGRKKLSIILDYTPPKTHEEHRQAFLLAIADIGEDPKLSEPGFVTWLYREKRPSLSEPFEKRTGVPMPETYWPRSVWFRRPKTAEETRRKKLAAASAYCEGTARRA